MAKRLLLVRHAESQFNADGLINADPAVPCPLTPTGVRQAEELGRVLTGERIDLCVTSELQRARETAEIALTGRDVPVAAWADLNEPAAGKFEGGPVDEYSAWLAKHGIDAANPGGGESQMQALTRFVHAFRLLGRRPEESVLVVAHGMPIAWFRAALEADGREPISLRVDFKNPGVPFAQVYPVIDHQVHVAVGNMTAFLQSRPGVAAER